MATKRKRKKTKTKRMSFRLGALKRKKRQKTDWFGPSLASVLKVLAAICVVGAIVIGLIFLEQYVNETVPAAKGMVDLELVDVPAWVDDQLREQVFALARGDGEDLGIDDDTAKSVWQNIDRLVPWLYEVKVEPAHDRLQIKGRWRKPIALVKSGRRKFYVDAEQVVLDFVQMPKLPIVEIKGLSSITRTPPLGEVWQRDDLAAAVRILDRLDQMDKSLTPDNPLLDEIDRIDVSNFNGREDRRHAHIILYADDNTEIIWGAELGKWQQHLESTDQHKLAKLYSHFKEYGKLSDGVKFINLRDPQDKIPRPIDRY